MSPFAAPPVDGYRPHWLHGDDRAWPETNCYVDLWIEVLHWLGLEPAAALAFTLSSDFEGDQWEFFKFPPEDLRDLYGVEVHELNIWRPLDEHIAEQLDFGHLMTVEMDSFFLPDTAGVSYRIGHQKSSITPVRLDREAETMRYFHNRAYAELAGDDYRGALRLDDPVGLVPYAEVIRLDRLVRLDDAELRKRSATLLATHVSRRPASNPVERLAVRVLADVPWLQESDPETFHGYAFATLRQLGAWAELASSYLTWLDGDCFGDAAAALGEISSTAKTCQFKLARVAAGRDTDLTALFAAMGERWGAAYASLVAAHDR